MPKTEIKVVRHGRHEMSRHTANADGEVYAGQGVVESDGKSTVTAGTDGTSRLCVAIDDRERGMELGDLYEDEDHVTYVAVSGGGLTLLLADGETVDPSAESRVVFDENGFLVPYDGGAHDESEVVGFVDEDEAIEADGNFEPVDVEVAS